MANNNEQGKATFDAAMKSEAFFENNKKTIAGVIVAIIVVVAGWFCYKQFISVPREEKASTALARGQEYFNAEQFDKALNGDGAGYVGFVKIASDYGSTDAGNLAKLYAGLCYAQLGKWQEAADKLDSYSPADDAMVSPAAVAALGNVYVSLNRIDDAVSNLKKAAKMADAKASTGRNLSLSPQFLLQAAELLESQGKTEEANAIYKDIKKNYVGSAIYRSIDKYIERTTK